MAYRVVRTDAFRQDLDSAIAYIVKTLENKPAAASLLDAIGKSYGELECMPRMFATCRDPHLKELGYRKIVIRNYIMVYKIDESENTVYLLRFFHGKQDYEKQI